MLLASESALISSDATVSGVDAAEGVVTGFIDSGVSEGASDIWKLSEPTEEPESSEVSSRTVLAADASALEDAVLEEQGQAELTCQFCDRVYRYTRDELEALLADMGRR